MIGMYLECFLRNWLDIFQTLFLPCVANLVHYTDAVVLRVKMLINDLIFIWWGM